MLETLVLISNSKQVSLIFIHVCIHCIEAEKDVRCTFPFEMFIMQSIGKEAHKLCTLHTFGG